MGDKTAISWADATWNVVTGCTRVSDGCDHCYIDRTPPLRMTGRHFDGTGPGSTTGLIFHPERLNLPLKWRQPRRIFVNSLADLFHEDVPDDYIVRVFAVMSVSARHTFQVLTKRHGRMRALLSDQAFPGAVMDDARSLAIRGSRFDPVQGGWPLRNVWTGVSVENQRWADIRIPALLSTPAAVRFLSVEPMLGPVDLTRWLHGGFGSAGDFGDLHWVIAGGESGPGARPMDPSWPRSLRDDCAAAGVAFHFKQWGGRTSKAGGRELDGRTYDEYPKGHHAAVT